jgi:GcrA cell cycle regulator
LKGAEWSLEAIETLKRLHAEGHSFGVIARALGATKNAVVGKAHRLGLPLRPAVNVPRAARPAKAKVQRVERVAHVVVRAAQPPKLVAPVVVAPEPPRPRVVRPARAGCCRWIGEVADGFSCSAPVARGSYCAEHAARVYVQRDGEAA